MLPDVGSTYEYDCRVWLQASDGDVTVLLSVPVEVLEMPDDSDSVGDASTDAVGSVSVPP